MQKYLTKSKTLFVSGAVILMMCLMALVGPQVYAVDLPLDPQDDLRSSEKAKERQEKYVEHEAIVMFKSAEKLTGRSGKSKAQSILSNKISDLKVNNLWLFSTTGELTKNSKGARKLVSTSDDPGYTAVALVRSESLTTMQLIKRMQARKDIVKYAEPNYIVQARDISNDAYSNFQWSMQGEVGSYSDTTPNVSYEWVEKGTTGSKDDYEMVVAILDTGIDYEHPDLADNIWKNKHKGVLKGEHGYDFINGDSDPMDDNGHGSHCAGIIGAAGDNGIGISGVNKNIKMMALKVLNEDGTASMSHEIQAYNYIDIALDEGVPVKAINNSWGGGEYSDIFEELINIVGEKGAISVCAAGNNGMDKDKVNEPDVPSDIDSPYIISVAATGRDGELAEYSNYGKESVDVAAPGSDILSTVPYENYNPTIYPEDKRDALSENFNDFSDPENHWGEQTIDPAEGTIYLDGERYDPNKSGDQPIIRLVDPEDDPEDYPTDGFENEGSMCLSIDNLKEGQIVYLTIPYEINTEAKTPPRFSIMAKASSDKPTFDGFYASTIGITDAPANATKDIELAVDNVNEVFINGKSSHWSHIEKEFPSEETLDDLIKKAKENAKNDGNDEIKTIEREALIFIYSNRDANYRIQIDDMGMSSQSIDSTADFEKYDYMTGTSMAAPFITGAVALKSAELKAGTEDVETVINEVVSSAKPSPELPIAQTGSFDFTMRPDNLPPRVGRITVGRTAAKLSDKTIAISGSGLGSVDLVEIGDDEGSLKPAEIKSKTDKKIIVEEPSNQNWINNIKTVKVTAGDHYSQREDVYLVNGKSSLAVLDDALEGVSAPMTTDGKHIYWANSMTSSIGFMPVASKDAFPDVFCEIDVDSIFKDKKRKTGNYGTLFGDDMAYANGSVFLVAEHGLMQTPEEEGLFITLSQGAGNSGDDFVFREKSFNGSEGSTIYAGQMRLISTYRKNGEVRAKGIKLPDDLNSTVDWTMASYNGKIYFIGGYSYAEDKDGNTEGISRKVKIYDPVKGKWSNGPSLPEGRAGGKAIQSGGKLIYTMGYSDAQKGKPVVEQKYPPNLILENGKWTVSKVKEDEALEPLVVDAVVTREGNKYITTEGSLGLIDGGIIYMGTPMRDYGDIFTYKNDKFEDTGYNHIRLIDSEEITGTVVADKLYGFDDRETYSMKVKSGLISIAKPKKIKNGSISGAGKYMPGNKASVTVKAKKNYRIKTLKINKKKIKLKKNQTVWKKNYTALTQNQTINTATFEKYKFKVKVSKKGKGKVAGGNKMYVKGKKATIKVKAAKGYYIKSIKLGNKTIKVKKNATSKNFKFKVKKDIAVKVVFAKKKKK